MYLIGIIGIGVLGKAIKETFEKFDRINNSILVKCYDKYKSDCNNVLCMKELLDTDILFLCLPTLYSLEKEEYDKSEIYNVCKELSRCNYNGIVVLKSTVEPGTTSGLVRQFNNLCIVHNPEFLSARTAQEDFENQKHIESEWAKKFQGQHARTHPEFRLCDLKEIQNLCL